MKNSKARKQEGKLDQLFCNQRVSVIVVTTQDCYSSDDSWHLTKVKIVRDWDSEIVCCQVVYGI